MRDAAALVRLPALLPSGGGALLCDETGAVRALPRQEAAAVLRGGDCLIVHAPFVAGRLNTALAKPVYDLLELFAFVHPACACAPGATGLAEALGLSLPQDDQARVRILRAAAERLFADIAAALDADKTQMRLLADHLQKTWRWAEPILALIGQQQRKTAPLSGFDVWRHLKKWEDEAPAGKPSAHPVTAEEAAARLRAFTDGGEHRPEQRSFAEAASLAFAPRARAGAPNIALIEAGTGIGKTLGYLAPASLWAEKNGPGLWLSTYTRNLQRQIAQEAAKLYPDPAIRSAKVVVRKGRENYLCLLNFEEVLKRGGQAGGQRLIALALIARFIRVSRDGDMSGAGFPAFLAAHLTLRDISDRRGECVYAACRHYRICFIEKIARLARKADIVIANHALVIARNAQEDESETATRPSRFVFDEGHHLFDAANSGFAASLSALEMADLRRWLRGPEGRGGRARNLSERLQDFVAEDGALRDVLAEAEACAGALAGEGFMGRIIAPRGPGEAFLSLVHAQVCARSDGWDRHYSQECEPYPCTDDLLRAAADLRGALGRIQAPLAKLTLSLRARLNKDAATLEPGMRARIEAHANGIERRARAVLPAWMAMLEDLTSGIVSDDFCDWFEIARADGRDQNIAMERRFIDPTKPLAEEILSKAHGAVITSATLRDGAAEEDWAGAEMRTGAHHLIEPPRRALFGSPFAYGEQARVFIVKDINRRDVEALAAGFRELFLAAGGGALGLFTAIRNLRAVESRLRAPLAEAGLSLYAQHVDALDTGALVDLFRGEENSCLLGTDALRDGVDVPGRSLRLVVFDKVPWPKPTILHKARRARFGKAYDDRLTRLRLKQAFGRLIRKRTDRGCFVILEPATPSRLLAALPPEVPVARCALAEAVREIGTFLRTADSGA